MSAALSVVPSSEAEREAELEALRIKSAKAGKHISDLIRADVAKRDWNRMHRNADRRHALPLSERIVRIRDGAEILLRPWFGRPSL